MNELLEISVAIKEELRARIGTPQSSFDLWFGDFNLTSLDENVAVFSTPTKLRRQILSTKNENDMTMAEKIHRCYRLCGRNRNPFS